MYIDFHISIRSNFLKWHEEFFYFILKIKSDINKYTFVFNLFD